MSPSLLRLIDANANRAAEAMRTIEDLARFILASRSLAESCKTLRHALRDAMALLPADRLALLASRDAAGDVGTTVEGAGEMCRADPASIAAAAGARLGQALRTIEEAAKALPSGQACARAVESIRYRAYDVERLVCLALGAGRARQWRVCVLLTESLCTHHPWERVARFAIDAGVDALQLREKTLDAREITARARALIDLARPRGVSVIVNDRPDIALAAGADAVHLGQTDLSVPDARRLAGSSLLIGLSTSDIEQARAAADAGADYCGVGPMFAGATKSRPRLAGPEFLLAYLGDPACARIPHLAIGGIDADRAGTLAGVGCRGVAVSSAVCSSPDPAGVCRAILRRLGGGVPGADTLVP